MKSYGEKITNETIVVKILCTLTPRFNFVVAAIEEAHDMSKYSFDELMSSLQAHEDRMNQSQEKHEEQAFQVKGESFNMTNSTGRGNGKGGFCGRGRGKGHGDGGRGRGRGDGRGHGQYNEQKQSNFQRYSLQCHHCKKFGHKEAYCWAKQRGETNHAGFTEAETLFMAYTKLEAKTEAKSVFVAHLPDSQSSKNVC
ncbi:hypothetical protein L6164_037530 [Bauhinia variegata]|uniref:Uncharacterized protein n=1 Tax=Bauhinia variegata TaxID=167791 RepID=A0ACB9KKA2_BAUVA|nr:hypothetical protein L6164_037530 [Bauhinia variegata]